MRKVAIVVALAAAFIAIPLVVLAARTSMTSRVDHQKGVAHLGKVSTSTTSWRRAPGLALNVCSKKEVSATLSVTLTGAPVQFRVLADAVPAVSPHKVYFDPTRRQRSFSFTFLSSSSTFEGSDAHNFTVQWRSPTGKKATLHAGTLNLVYQKGGGSSPTGVCL
ncbi:MAG: hypothetical protein QOD46_1428 [Actinomycetota bacterium]|nr:hypothetical protein [Actinomycetota bacterium]